MKNKLEKVNLTSHKAIALEIAALGLIAYRYREKWLYRNDNPDQKKAPPTPMSETVGEDIVYFSPSENGNFQSGLVPKMGNIFGIFGTSSRKEGNEEEHIVIDESISENDTAKLEKLKQAMAQVADRWRERANS